MSTITTINASDLISASRSDINSNFAALNEDKIETSVIDTDTAMAANSDAKVPSQKAVKTYIDSVGGANASETVRGIVEEATDAEVAADSATGSTGAKLFITPTKLGASKHSASRNVTAGETIAGATLAVPVYQNKTDNEFYKCDGNDLTKLKFNGFAITNSTDGQPIKVQFNGIVSGFSGLDEGQKYYLSDTVGTISNAPGTYEVLVGVAISTTELVIQRGKRFASGVADFSSTTTTDITLGFRPSLIRIHAVVSGDVAGEGNSQGGWSVFGGNSCVKANRDAGGNAVATDAANAWSVGTGGTVNHTGTITTITDTGFTLSNVEASGITGVYLYWTAEGEL